MKLINTIFLILSFSCTSLFAQDLLTKQTPLPCLNKKFTIVAHIVQSQNTTVDLSDFANSIAGSIDTLNGLFEPICVSFEVCDFNIIENYQYDTLGMNPNEWGELQVLYNKDRRINMYFLTEPIEGDPVCGFASLGGITLLESGGIVINSPGCLFHEMGHYFGLKHTFDPTGSMTDMTAELVDGSNCETTGDMICDTPADPFVEGDTTTVYVDVNLGCRFVATMVDANGEFYKPDVGNIMSYYEGACSCGFTHGQYLRMVETCQSADPSMW